MVNGGGFSLAFKGMLHPVGVPFSRLRVYEKGKDFTTLCSSVL